MPTFIHPACAPSVFCCGVSVNQAWNDIISAAQPTHLLRVNIAAIGSVLTIVFPRSLSSFFWLGC